MRQQIGAKKVAKLRRETGLPVEKALVRGGTNHRIDLLLAGGRVIHYWRQDHAFLESSLTWKLRETQEDKK